MADALGVTALIYLCSFGDSTRHTQNECSFCTMSVMIDGGLVAGKYVLITVGLKSSLLIS